MRIKQLLTKTLLAAAGLCVGASAWADATSIYERGTTKAWSASDIGEGAWSAASAGTAEITENGLKYTSPNNGGGSTTLALSTKENSKLVWTFTWNTGTSTGRAGNKNYLKFGDVELRAQGQDQKAYIVIGGEATEISSTTNDVRYDAVWTGTITIDKATGNVSYTVVLPNAGTKTGTGTLASTDFSSVVLGFERGGRTTTSNSTLQKIEITEEEQTVTTADYTVKYMCGTTEVKDAVTRTGVVGEAITLTASDIVNVYKDGKKYIYTGNDSEDYTIAEGVVVTVSFREAVKYTYTLNAVDAEENVLKELATGEQFEGDAQRVYYSRSFKKDGKWYTAAANGSYPSYGVDFTEAATKTVTYAVEDIAYFFEVNDFTAPGGFVAGAAYPERFSNGNGARLAAARYAYSEPLEGGVYTITMWGRNQAGSSTANIQLIARDADGNEGTAVTFDEDWAAGSQGAKVIEGVVIPVGSSLEVKNTSDEWNSNLEMDYVILVKTGEAPAVTKSVTMGANGYATFASKNALDLANLPTGLKAYTATLSGKELSFNVKADAAVAAGTGLLLKGNAGETYEIPVAATGAAVAGNALTGVTTATDLQSNKEGNYIFVMKKAATASDELTFLPLTTESAVTVPAGKAYVSVPATAFAGTARALTVSFDDETTGINNVVTTMQQDGIYSLSGQRVMQPSKGLYIVNGKKVIIK